MIQEILVFLKEHYEAVIAISALGLAIYNAVLTRHHNRISVKPLLNFLRTFDLNDKNGKIRFVCSLHNRGLGPAIITDTKISSSGETWDMHEKNIAMKLQEVIQNIKDEHQDPLRADVNVIIVAAGNIIDASEKLDFIEVECDMFTDSTKKAIYNFFINLDACIKYEDLYKKKYTSERFIN